MLIEPRRELQPTGVGQDEAVVQVSSTPKDKPNFHTPWDD
jgi:hypothetical protein